MNIIRKDATITNTDEDFPGAFEVVLSTSTKDRDGDELAPEDWQQPLPDHITFDVDHGMSVEKTIGSGEPSIEDGKLIVRGTYSSLPRAQEVRTLVKEGHIRTTSVAFSSKKSTKDGVSRTTRELLNGAFVAIPANTEAVVLSAKAGARNSTSDQKNLQAAHDAVVAVGATCTGPEDSTEADEGATGGKSFLRMVAAKAVDGSYEQREQAISDALSARYPGDDMWAYSIATFDDSVVYRVSGSSDLRGQWQAPYTYDEGTVSLGEASRVNLVEQVVPMKSYRGTKAMTEADAVATTNEDLFGDALNAEGSQDPVSDEETTSNADEKSADADALDLQMLALRVIASAHIG